MHTDARVLAPVPPPPGLCGQQQENHVGKPRSGKIRAPQAHQAVSS